MKRPKRNSQNKTTAETTENLKLQEKWKCKNINIWILLCAGNPEDFDYISTEY
jgi:hypothetical protein